MRISTPTIQCMKSLVANNFGESAMVYLFGSRVDDSLKGGDIDLLIDTNEITNGSLYATKIKFLARLKQAIGDQKIDVIIAQKNDSRNIVKKALQMGILL